MSSRAAFPFSESMEVPGIAREADLLVRSPLAEFGLLDFKSFGRIADIGYRHAREQMEKWLASMAGAPPW